MQKKKSTKKSVKAQGKVNKHGLTHGELPKGKKSIQPGIALPSM